MAGSADQDRVAALRARALRYLSQRDHSRVELERKLLRAGTRHPVAPQPDSSDSAEAESSGSSADPAFVEGTGRACRVPAAAVHQVLDDLGARGLQSDARTAEALVSAKSARWGARRLQAEMQHRGIAPELIDAALMPLRDSELDRARALWLRRFGTVAADPAERARQARYLAGRGFPAEVIRRVVSGTDDES